MENPYDLFALDEISRVNHALLTDSLDMYAYQGDVHALRQGYRETGCAFDHETGSLLAQPHATFEPCADVPHDHSRRSLYKEHSMLRHDDLDMHLPYPGDFCEQSFDLGDRGDLLCPTTDNNSTYLNGDFSNASLGGSTRSRTCVCLCMEHPSSLVLCSITFAVAHSV